MPRGCGRFRPISTLWFVPSVSLVMVTYCLTRTKYGLYNVVCWGFLVISGTPLLLVPTLCICIWYLKERCWKGERGRYVCGKVKCGMVEGYRRWIFIRCYLVMRICTESEKKADSYLPYLIKESRTSINENVVRWKEPSPHPSRGPLATSKSLGNKNPGFINHYPSNGYCRWWEIWDRLSYPQIGSELIAQERVRQGGEEEGRGEEEEEREARSEGDGRGGESGVGEERSRRGEEGG